MSWGTDMGPLSFGVATLDRDLCAASVLAIDLTELTTSAQEAAKRKALNMFAVHGPVDGGTGAPLGHRARPLAPQPGCTLGQLVEHLRHFGEEYYRVEDQIREENPMNAKHFRVQLGANVSEARDRLLATPDFSVLREWVQSEWKEEISFAAGRRIVDTLVEPRRAAVCPRAPSKA